MKLSAVLAHAVLLFSSLGAAAPIDGYDDALDVRAVGDSPDLPSGLVARAKKTEPMPSLDTFKAQFKDIGPDTCLFYSGVFIGGPSEKNVMELRDSRSYLHGYRILKETWKDESYTKLAGKVKPSAKAFFAQASMALAQECEGVVYVLLGDGSGQNWPSGTIWANQEWPNLRRGAGVTKVIRLNEKNDNQETIWEMTVPHPVTPPTPPTPPAPPAPPKN
ncbi:hypothetical protein JX265_006893 [Neoarthrinium moseri]|uniref:Uncharacterized protein n=1 Tax=Neoarthrinium moseri TaxID=1658444 RepID=A0A9Q0AQ15_9PEZI|nr:uncharacterized protein JN550_002633 [Neoarthrinium moseri]KAI1842266.1 hypothetical protein JX266_011551 [Neoarthrinium moseri]KAI1868914.1 hypothetical protein JX265_006893 [Neoarthrinium moseri]KAI1874054.1 hypothetical protein JN550_002633 [Neoarthrinium moseri]